MRKIVVCFGSFSLSDKAIEMYADLNHIELYTKSDERFSLFYKTYYRVDNNEYFNDKDIPRDDMILIQVVELLGREADGENAKLKIVEIPDDIEWKIEEYDGYEHVAEKHRTWS